MPKDKFDALGPLMNEIGQELANIVGGDPHGVFLYVEIAEGWVSSSVFKNEGDLVRYYDAVHSNLSDLLWEAWYLESDDSGIKRWSVLEYSVKDGKFEVIYKYPDEVEVDVYDADDLRRGAALRARFGDKPVVYPPMPETAVELKLKD